MPMYHDFDDEDDGGGGEIFRLDLDESDAVENHQDYDSVGVLLCTIPFVLRMVCRKVFYVHCGYNVFVWVTMN